MYAFREEIDAASKFLSAAIKIPIYVASSRSEEPLKIAGSATSKVAHVTNNERQREITDIYLRAWKEKKKIISKKDYI